jgi:uracil-DNA glycosylase
MAMVTRPAFKAEYSSLTALRAAEAACWRCPLYQDATQVVPGEGPARARMILVGEQPGDQEDLQGRPFVGPAGRILDKALQDAGINRSRVFVTNAVKHFKFEQRGKRRLHKRPNNYEIERCKHWFEQERALLHPDVVMALGVSAARAVLGKAVTITAMRGRFTELPDGTQATVTIHPSYLLRIRDREDKKKEYEKFVADLRLAARATRKHAA